MASKARRCAGQAWARGPRQRADHPPSSLQAKRQANRPLFTRRHATRDKRPIKRSDVEAKEANGAEEAEEAELLDGSQLTRNQIKKLFPELPSRPPRDPATGWMALGPAGKGKRYWYNDVTGESYVVGSAEETRNGKKYNKETDRRTYPR